MWHLLLLRDNRITGELRPRRALIHAIRKPLVLHPTTREVPSVERQIRRVVRRTQARRIRVVVEGSSCERLDTIAARDCNGKRSPGHQVSAGGVAP
jgi:hypothetical protein